MSDLLADLRRLDCGLDELNASQGNGPTTGESAGAGGVEPAGALVATAAELRASVPAARPETAARAREAFLACTDRFLAAQAVRRRRRVLVRAAALAAALLLVGIPGALARQALPGSPLYPIHEATQDARLALTSSPVRKARILLDEAERMRDEAVRNAAERDRCIRIGRADATRALATLHGVTAAAAQHEVARANQLLHDFRDLAEGRLPGGDRGSGDDRSGKGGGDDRQGGSGSGGGPSGSHGGSGSGSGGDDGGGSGGGSGSSDSGPGSSGSGSDATSGGSGSTSGGGDSSSGGSGKSGGGGGDG